MRSFKPSADDIIPLKAADGTTVDILKTATFDAFSPSILGLGDIRQDAVAIPAIVAVFDLQGFTDFCRQSDPHLSVPDYLSNFLDWMFESIRMETVKKRHDEGIECWHPLPCLAKFMGDGLILLWNVHDMDTVANHHLLVSLENIAARYVTEFLPAMRRKVVAPPALLRCGVARGTVYTVGNGSDFVGPSINMAARLQKLPGCTFAFARRGFNPENLWGGEYLDKWMLVTVEVRGIGEGELVYILKSEYEAMSEAQRGYYLVP